MSPVMARTRLRLWSLALAGALLGLLAPGLALASAVPASAAGERYVALGDSYSSGTGTRSYIDDGTSCQRSTVAYPSLIASGAGYDLNFRACSGARIPDVRASQLGALDATTTLVSISIGGNDAGFADVLTECATPFWAGDCDGAIDGAQSFVSGTLPGQLSALYAEIRAAAPNARVVVVGYPRIFMGEDCNALTWFSPEEQARLNQMADLINSVTSTQAANAGFGYADPTSAFVGHAVCDDPEWINGLSNPISESYHPNVAGQQSGYTPTVSPVLTGAALAVTASTVEAARASGPALAQQQRAYAAQDRTIEPKQFVVPDMDSAEMRAKARKAGIDLERWLANHR